MDSTLAMGTELLLAGARIPFPEIRKLAEQVAADHGAFPDLVEGLVLPAKGVMRRG